MMRRVPCCMPPPTSGRGGNDDEAGPSQPAASDDGEETRTFGFEQLRAATNNFHIKNYLGEGGIGIMFKGYLPNVPEILDAQPLAIKKLDLQGLQGPKEFVDVILMLAILKHPNLVKLYGYCSHGNERLLVYEFMAEGSLRSHLCDLPPNRQPLQWNTRVKIATDAAKGLVYLHHIANPPIIHGDVKSANILLDAEFNAKLSDFGLARIGPVGDQTHVTTRILGTQGYCAPEYALTGRPTFMSDVYSFGVTLLELITGQRAKWMKPFRHDARRYSELAHPSLQGRYPVEGFRRLLQLAWSCLREDAKARPCMREVLRGLERVASHPHI